MCPVILENKKNKKGVRPIAHQPDTDTPGLERRPARDNDDISLKPESIELIYAMQLFSVMVW